MTTTNRQVIERYFEAINAEDWELLETLFDADVEFKATGAPSRTGRDKVMRFYPRAFARFPTHDDRPTRIVGLGDTYVAEIRFEGTVGNGTEVAFDAVDVFDIADGKIRRISQWFDTADLERQVTGRSA